MGDGCEQAANALVVSAKIEKRGANGGAHEEDRLLQREFLYAAFDDARAESDDSSLHPNKCRPTTSRTKRTKTLANGTHHFDRPAERELALDTKLPTRKISISNAQSARGERGRTYIPLREMEVPH
jgi:hypothetical protein